MSHEQPTIFLIDDDASIRRALGRVMTSAGLDWKAFESVDEFLASDNLSRTGCVVADMTMLGINGLELKHFLNSAGSMLPVIFLTAHDTEEMRAAARDAGAVAFFRKPVDMQALLDAVEWALNQPHPHAA